MAESLRTWADAAPPAPLAYTHEQKFELALLLARELRTLQATVRSWDRMPRHEQAKLEGVAALQERAENLRTVLEKMTAPAPAPDALAQALALVRAAVDAAQHPCHEEVLAAIELLERACVAPSTRELPL